MTSVSCMLPFAWPRETMICGSSGLTDRSAADSASSCSGATADRHWVPSTSGTNSSAINAIPIAAGKVMSASASVRFLR